MEEECNKNLIKIHEEETKARPLQPQKKHTHTHDEKSVTVSIAFQIKRINTCHHANMNSSFFHGTSRGEIVN